MAQAKIEPGETDISLAGRQTPRKQTGALAPNRDERPMGRKPSSKKKNDQPKASPLDRGIDLGK